MNNLSKLLLGLFITASCVVPLLGSVPSVLTALVFTLVYFEKRAFDYEKLKHEKALAQETLKVLSDKKENTSVDLANVQKELSDHQSKLNAIGIRLGMKL